MKIRFFTIVCLIHSLSITCAGAAPLHTVPAQLLPATYPIEVDLGMNEIVINFRMSTESVLGKDFKLHSEGKDLWSVRCLNEDKSEELVMYRHGNGPVNSFQEFHVRQLSAEDVEKLPGTIDCSLSPEHFVSFRGVRLGITISDLIGIFGDSYHTESRSGVITVSYAIESNLRSDFLKHYNRRNYFAHYHFIKGRLRSYAFGFDERTS